MKTIAFSCALALALGLALVPAAEARDIEITVPVRITSLHPTIAVGRVQCAAYNSGRTSMVGQAAHTDFNLVDGSFSGDVMVRVTLPDAWLARASEWACTLRFVRPYEGSAHTFSLEGGAFFHEEFRLAPGSEHRFEVHGTL